MKDVIIKIGKETNHVKAGKAIEMLILQGNTVFIDAIGIEANYTATKSLIQVRKALLNMCISVAFFPSYEDLKDNGKFKTVIRWNVIKEE